MKIKTFIAGMLIVLFLLLVLFLSNLLLKANALPLSRPSSNTILTENNFKEDTTNKLVTTEKLAKSYPEIIQTPFNSVLPVATPANAHSTLPQPRLLNVVSLQSLDSRLWLQRLLPVFPQLCVRLGQQPLRSFCAGAVLVRKDGNLPRNESVSRKSVHGRRRF
eukprot:TRINITY_DN2261_c0_g1_i9.p1 TRINITY_DN2261_c0_g1~~TRINITY_DN2261_c0_g1_i9.p1  ORF type:complete len:163 (+),score=1.59 TRINITY_DN2261_c0_g1_i9:163-651(+)